MFVLKNTRQVYANRWITVTEDEAVRPGGPRRRADTGPGRRTG